MSLRAWLAATLLLAASGLAPLPLPAQEARPLSAVVLHPGEVARGEVLSGFVVGQESFQRLEALLADGSGVPVAMGPAFPVARGGRVWAFLLPVASTLAGGEYRLELEGGKTGALGPKQFVYGGPVQVRARSFPSERIRFDQALSRLMTQPDPRKDQETRKLSELLQHTGAEAIWYMGPFTLPVRGARLTAGFADRRVYDLADGGSSQSLHNGLDLAAAQGTPVAACGAGRIVLAENRLLTGNSVVIEHLPGIYSLYYHLSELAVAEGQWVRVGQRIGAVGMTGLATGPHLHWELRVAAQPVDPLAFIGRPLVDKALLLSIIKENALDERR
jgi:murein DD-endopeptidase MepM/ murein hydrolase activator NlpD